MWRQCHLQVVDCKYCVLFLTGYPLHQRRRRRPLAPPISRRNGKTQHLRDRIPMNAKPLRRFPAAQPINYHCVSDLGIKFHCEHPSSPSMPINGIETAYKDRYTFAPPSKRSAQPVQWYTLRPRFIPILKTFGLAIESSSPFTVLHICRIALPASSNRSPATVGTTGERRRSSN